MSNRFKEYCRDVASQVRTQIDANNILRTLSQDQAEITTMEISKKNRQNINLYINGYFYCNVIINWKNIRIIKGSSNNLDYRINSINKKYNVNHSEDIELERVEELIEFIKKYF